MKLTEVSDRELVARMQSLCVDGRRIEARLIEHLIEVEARRLHLKAACSSLFAFCTRRLGMSEGAAFRRINAARLVQRFPSLLGHLESGRIHLSSLVFLRDHVTESNVEDLVATASGLGKRQLQELVARLAPQPDVPSQIRKLPAPAVTQPLPLPPALPLPLPLPLPPSLPLRPAVSVTPLSPDRYKVQLTIGTELRDKLERARDLMGHRNPSGDLSEVVERALDLLLEKLAKERLGATSRPDTQRTGSAASAKIPRAVRRAVFARDGEQCTFVAPDGERCSSRTRLELDHLRARARHGDASETNLRVLCRAHNRLHAEQDFGRDHVDAAIRFRQRKCRADKAPTRA